MHKLFQQQLEKALEQLEFPSSSPNNHSSLLNPSSLDHHSQTKTYSNSNKKYSLSPSSSSNNYNHNNNSNNIYNNYSTSPSDYPRKRSQSCVVESSDHLDVVSSLSALETLHEKLKMYSQENKKLKMQLANECKSREEKKGFGGSYGTCSYQELDYENFILKKENEELMGRVDELERKMRELESRRMEEENREEMIEESDEDLNSFDKLIEESNDHEESVEDLSILLENEELFKEKKPNDSTMEMKIVLDVSIQCESIIEMDDKETNTEEEQQDNLEQSVLLDSDEKEEAEKKSSPETVESSAIISQIETVSEETQTMEDSPPVVDNSHLIQQLTEQIVQLKKELQLKTDLISTLTMEKQQYDKNEQEHQKVMTYLTSHVKELVRESALLRQEYNESIRKLKEELIACNHDNNKQ